MKPRIIRPTEIARRIRTALEALAKSMEQQASPQRSLVHEEVLRDLSAWMELGDALQLMNYVTEARIKCVRCGAGRGITRASGAHCLECARQLRNEIAAG